MQKAGGFIGLGGPVFYLEFVKLLGGLERAFEKKKTTAFKWKNRESWRVSLRTSRVILLVIIVSLVGFGLLGLNSQRIGYDAEFDTKLITIDKPKRDGVLIPI